MSSSCMSQTGQDPRALVKRGSLPLHTETKQIFPEHLPRARLYWANKQQKRQFSGILILVSIPLSPAQGVGAGKPLCSWLRARGPLSASCRGFACSQGAACLRRDSRWGGRYGFCCRHPRSQTLVPGAAGEGETEGPPNTLIAPR